MGINRQLSIPSAADSDPEAFELVRVWVGGGEQHVSLKAGVWDDPASWGIVLADLAGHVANAYEQMGGGNVDREQVMRRIIAGWDAELSSPTDEPSGRLLD